MGKCYATIVNQAGAITVLDFLDAQQAIQLCENLMNEVYNVSLLGSPAKAILMVGFLLIQLKIPTDHTVELHYVSNC